ncbi:hypothetical protein RBY4I_3099 [Rhodobacterales bacterium Y4I]|nr:hypothetical protein RBY4I_3099 [Rhodobacterales bacterium Y4I]
MQNAAPGASPGTASARQDGRPRRGGCSELRQQPQHLRGFCSQ